MCEQSDCYLASSGADCVSLQISRQGVFSESVLSRECIDPSPLTTDMTTIDTKTFFKPEPAPEHDALVLLSRHLAAARLSISVATLDRLTRAGELPRIKLAGKVLYRPQSLDEFARRKEGQATTVNATPHPANQYSVVRSSSKPVR